MDRATEEALCDAQAQLSVLRLALRVLARTHPDPVALLAAWREALTEAATCSPVAPSGSRGSACIDDRMQAGVEDWTAELVELAVSAADDAIMQAMPQPSVQPTMPSPRDGAR